MTRLRQGHDAAGEGMTKSAITSFGVPPFLFIRLGVGVARLGLFRFCGRRDILRRKIESSSHSISLRLREINIGVTPPTPGPFARAENIGRLLHECPLLLQRQLNHSPAIIWSAESSEYLPYQSEIGVTHVGYFHST